MRVIGLFFALASVLQVKFFLVPHRCKEVYCGVDFGTNLVLGVVAPSVGEVLDELVFLG